MCKINVVKEDMRTRDKYSHILIDSAHALNYLIGGKLWAYLVIYDNINDRYSAIDFVRIEGNSDDIESICNKALSTDFIAIAA